VHTPFNINQKKRGGEKKKRRENISLNLLGEKRKQSGEQELPVMHDDDNR